MFFFHPVSYRYNIVAFKKVFTIINERLSKWNSLWLSFKFQRNEVDNKLNSLIKLIKKWNFISISEIYLSTLNKYFYKYLIRSFEEQWWRNDNLKALIWYLIRALISKGEKMMRNISFRNKQINQRSTNEKHAFNYLGSLKVNSV